MIKVFKVKLKLMIKVFNVYFTTIIFDEHLEVKYYL